MTGRSGLVIGWSVVALSAATTVAAALVYSRLWYRIVFGELMPDSDYRLTETAWDVSAVGSVTMGVALVVVLTAHALRWPHPPGAMTTRLARWWPLLLGVAGVAMLVVAAALTWSGATDTAVPPQPGSVRAPELGADNIRDVLNLAMLTAGVVLLAAVGPVAAGSRRRRGIVGMAASWAVVVLALAGSAVTHAVTFAMRRDLQVQFGAGTPFGTELERVWRMVEQASATGPALATGAMFAALLLLAVHAWRWQVVRTERVEAEGARVEHTGPEPASSEHVTA